MAEKIMTLEIITPEKTELKAEINALSAPSVSGSLGILFNHAPIVALLDIGELSYKDMKNTEQVLAISDGVLEVHKNKISVLVHSAEKPDEIDVERARKAKERAEKRLRDKTHNIDLTRAEAALKRSLLRLKLSKHI